MLDRSALTDPGSDAVKSSKVTESLKVTEDCIGEEN